MTLKRKKTNLNRLNEAPWPSRSQQVRKERREQLTPLDRPDDNYYLLPDEPRKQEKDNQPDGFCCFICFFGGVHTQTAANHGDAA